MKKANHLLESRERFRKVFWEKKRGGRPPVGVINTDIYLPVKYLRRSFLKGRVDPEDINPDLVMTDYEYGFANRPVNIDDWIPFAAPWRAIPWLEAWCGCPVNYSSGSLAPGHIYGDIDSLTRGPIPAQEKWINCMAEQTSMLFNTAPEDCWISPSILRGCSDVLAALRGIEGFCFDLILHPDLIHLNAGRVNSLLKNAVDVHFSIVQPKLDGYGHIFGYWAPEPTIAIQEDMMGFCRPEEYRDIFMQHNAEFVKHLGNCVFFHMHSTGFKHYKHVLNIPGLAGIQMTVESNGPPMKQLMPVFKDILEQSRLILFADNRFEELSGILSELPSEGLYVVVPEVFISSDAEYIEFLSLIKWNKSS